MSSFNVNIISGSVELREGELLLVNSESTINVRTELGRKESITNRAYSINADSTNTQYPVAKAVYDFVSSSVAEVPKVEEVWVRGSGAGSVQLSKSVASGPYAVAEGTKSVASGTGSHAEGFRTTASANYSHAEGSYTVASGAVSHAEGNQTYAYGNYSHTEGQQTTTRNTYAHAEGLMSLASGSASHAEGYDNDAVGDYSHAEGRSTVASGNCSHVEGQYTRASGDSAHAEGFGTTASALYSHAEGVYTIASGNYSHAEGAYSKTTNNSEHAAGKSNATASSQIFSIGVGSSNTDRKNAISIITGSGAASSASVYVYGIGTYVGNNPVPGTNDLASVIAKISASAVPTDLSGLFASASYDSTAKKIYFYDNQSTASGEIDATAFIKDGMVDTVTINTGSNQMIITFNTDAGKEDIELNLVDIFNPNNFYTKDEINDITASISGSVNGKQDYFADVENSEDGTYLIVPGTGSEGYFREYVFRVLTDSGEWASGIGVDPSTVGLTAGDFETASAELSLVTEEGNTPYAYLQLQDKRTSQQASYLLGVDGVDLNQKQVHNLADPTSSQDAATKNYVDSAISNIPSVDTSSLVKNSETGSWTSASNWLRVNSASIVTESVWIRDTGDGSAVLSGSFRSTASGQRSVIIGRYNTVTAAETLAVGQYNTGSGAFSLLVGTQNTAKGLKSFALGGQATSSGDHSFAQGSNVSALGACSYAGGLRTFASNSCEHAQGKYNATASSQIFSVGVGDSEARRKNAISVITGSGTVSSASIYVYGVGSYNGTNPQPGVNDVATVISNISASSGGLTSESDPVYLADSASLKASASLAKSAIQPAATSSWAAAATWVTANSSSALAVSPASVTASINAAVGGITASHHTHSNKSLLDSIDDAAVSSWDDAADYAHTHSNKAVLDGITAAKTASWDSKLSSESDPIYLADSASLKSAATWLGSNSASLLTSESDPVYLADSASLKASGSLAKNLTAISASLIASGTLAKNVTAITASLVASASIAKTASSSAAAVSALTSSLVASASVAQTASSSAAAISAKTGSWDALVGLPTVTAADNGKILRVVNGAWALVDPVTVYSGQGAPDSTLGQDGDIYLQS